MSLSPSRRPPSSHSLPKPSARGKKSNLRRGIGLLVLLCVLWIYYGIDQRKKNFESGVRTPDHTEGTLTASTGDETSHPAVFYDAYYSTHSPTIAAILPVTTSSLPHLSESLSGLSTIPYLSEVHLLCPETMANAVRRSLQQILSHAQGFGRTEFFVALWQHELSMAGSTLQVASGTFSNRVLILPQDGLTGIGSTFRNTLLFGPPSLPVPLGLGGPGSGVSCGVKFQGFLAARFVSPPLLLPSRLGTTNQSYFRLASWEELGEHFTQAEGVGGVVPSATLESKNNCHSLDVLDTVVLDPQRLNSSPGSFDSSVSLVVLVAESGDTPALSKLACEFESRGAEVRLVTYGIPSDSIHPAKEGCNVTVTRLDPQEPTPHQLFGRSRGIFMTLTEYPLLPESLLEATARETIIRIPRRDLPYCDWITSLGIRELQSENSSKFRRLGCSDRSRLARPQGRDFCHHK